MVLVARLAARCAASSTFSLHTASVPAALPIMMPPFANRHFLQAGEGGWNLAQLTSGEQ
jgi:hypothetical protein